MSCTKIGHMMPASVPKPLETPIRILAYRGAMSKWFTLKLASTHTNEE